MNKHIITLHEFENEEMLGKHSKSLFVQYFSYASYCWPQYLIYVEDKKPVFCTIAKNVLKNSFCFLHAILFLQYFLVCTSLEKFMAQSTVWG